MGGDHKCPVCQATFTRPQHVARHMRSHTGDRPYKCQHCGDQFARSDLLSRHVNKCHASEKPLPNASGTRRKGAVSATRATTSKQSCDQCVVSTLPCDGCNPCSKCVSRKSRCTFVKFHRQTAPIGPGHNTRPMAPADSAGDSLPPSAFSNGGPSSRLPLYQHSDDEFVLGPAPGSVPSMAETLYGTNSFAFPPLYPPNTDLNSMPDNLDYGAKYRAQQAEFFSPGRSGMGTGLTPLFDPRHGTSATNPSWINGWESQDAHDVFHHPQHQTRQPELMPNHGPSAMHDKPELAHHPAPNFGNLVDSNPPIPMTMPYPAAIAFPKPQTSSRHHHGQDKTSANSYDSSNSSRRGSTDYSGSDSTSGSVPCSANNSNVHLPLGNAAVNPLSYSNTEYNLASNIPDRTSSASSDSSQHGRYNPQEDRQEFSSAFGLLSLDDPAVIAGLAVDGQPFFDDPSQTHYRQESTDPEQNHDGLLTTDIGPDIDTPMPLKRDAAHIQLPSISQRPTTSSGAPGGGLGGATGSGFCTSFGIGNLPTPSKDADTRELREFWREYMRTPLSAPQDATGNLIGPSVVNSKNPSPTAHRRQRVASLPAVKTPMVERDDVFVQGFGYHPTQQPDQRGRENTAAVGPTSSLRTTLHAKEDLRSYEAAVMARKAPTLNLQLKRPVKGKSAPHPQARCEAKDGQRSNASPQVGYGSRPPSSSGVPPSSTLANAFAGHGNGVVPLASTRSMTGKEESVSPSLSSSRHTSVDAYSTASSEVELRPSFKRLASQTLGPENSKRAFFGYDGDELGERDKTAGWTATVPEVQLSEFAGDLNGTNHPFGSIAERRRRRMSAPSSTLEPVNPHSQPTRPLGYAPAAQGGAG